MRKFICAFTNSCSADTPSIRFLNATDIEEAVKYFLNCFASYRGSKSVFANPDTVIDCLSEIRDECFESIIDECNGSIIYVTIRPLDDLSEIKPD